MLQTSGETTDDVDPSNGAQETVTIDASRTGRPVMSWLRFRLLPWTIFTAVSAVFLRPILIAPIIGDDFLNPWFQFPSAGMSIDGIARYSIEGTQNAGHFNFLGQVIGGYLNAIWIWMMAELHIRYTAIYAVVKLIVYVLTVMSVASFVRTACDAAGRPISVWRSRIYVAVPLFAILQIHLPWSHDPVANYPTSGFASAALGFLVLRWGILAFTSTTLRPSIICGSLGIVSILYYEINVAAVAALVPLAIWAWIRAGRNGPALKQLGLPVAITMVVPAIATVLLRSYAASHRIDYSGTDVAIGGELLDAFRISFLSTLPGAGWDLSLEFLNGVIPVRKFGTVVVLATCVLLFILARRCPEAEPGADRSQVRRGAGTLMGLSAGVYWVGAIVIQASTAKVQAEISRIGAVYNFYAIGTAALAAILVLAVRLRPKSLDRDVVLIGLVGVFIAFASVQYMINQSISDQFQNYTIQNRALHAAFSDGPSMAERCRVLTEWEAIVWPEYVEVTMIDGLQASWQHFNGEPFCEGFTRSS